MRFRLKLSVFFVTAFVFCCAIPGVFAQEDLKNPAQKEFEEKARKSIRGRMEREQEENEIPEWMIKRQYDPTKQNVRTRFGNFPLGRSPRYLPNPNPRLTGGVIFGRNDRFLGLDPNDPTSRFKPQSLEDEVPVTAQDSLPDKPREEVPSANTIAPADTPSQPVPTRRLPGLFERPGIMEPPNLVPEENLARTPGEQRWFRDIGRRPGPENMDSGPQTGSAMSGTAVSAGPELLRSPTENAPNRQEDMIRSTAAPNPRATAADLAAQRRRFEQQLEKMLINQSRAHFLSPIQISYQNGVATVRGVVTNQQHKVAAGNVLLSHPSVKQVNNLISVIPEDPGKNPPPIIPQD